MAKMDEDHRHRERDVWLQ